MLIILAAVWFRAYRIQDMPPGVFIDETNTAIDALRMLEGNGASLFATGWYEVPNAYAYVQAQLFRLFGATFAAVKLQSILPGVLTVIALYFLGRELFGAVPALFGAAFLAFNRWHFHMSRWGWVEVYPPLMQVLALLFIERGARRRNWGDWALAGLFLGLGMYTYLAIRMAVIAIGLYLVYRALVQRGFLRHNWQGILIFGVIYVLTFAPLGFTYFKNPFTLLNRSQQVSIMRDVEESGGSYTPVRESVLRHLRMFNVAGDTNPPPKPTRRAHARPYHWRLLPVGRGLGRVAVERPPPRHVAHLGGRDVAGRHPLAFGRSPPSLSYPGSDPGDCLARRRRL